MKQKKISRQITYWLGIIAVGLLVGLSLQFAKAWSEPDTAAPGGNVRGPLNTGSAYQSKDGGLGASYLQGNFGTGDQASLVRWGLNSAGDLSIWSAKGRNIFLTDSWYSEGTLNIIFNKTVFKTGNVGIGIDNPVAPLHIFNTGTLPDGSLASAVLGSQYDHWTYFGGNKSGRIRGSNEGYLVVDSNPTGSGDNRLYLNRDSSGDIAMALGGGNVGIGIFDPGAALTVGKTNTTWSGWNESIRLQTGSHAAVTNPDAGLLFGFHSDGNFYWANMNGGGNYSAHLSRSGGFYAYNYVAAPQLCIGGDCRSAWPGGGGITGSGTQWYFPMWTGATTLGDSDFYMDTRNGGFTMRNRDLHVGVDLYVGSNAIVNNKLTARVVSASTLETSGSVKFTTLYGEGAAPACNESNAGMVIIMYDNEGTSGYMSQLNVCTKYTLDGAGTRPTGYYEWRKLGGSSR